MSCNLDESLFVFLAREKNVNSAAVWHLRLQARMLDEYKRRRVEERTKAIVETFTKEYLLAYKDALIDKIRKEYNKEPKEPKQLLTPPVRIIYHPFRLIARRFPLSPLRRAT